MARLLILRDRAAADATAEAVRRAGHVPLLLPLQEISPLDPPLPPGPFAGFLVTSANAVPWLARRRPGDGPPVLAVGARTAQAARAAGLGPVQEGAGEALSLREPARALARRTGLPLLYAAGRVREPSLERALRADGTPFALAEAYEARLRQPAREEVAAALQGRAPDAVLLLSASQARGHAALAEAFADLFEPAPRLLCLSARVAAALPPPLAACVMVGERPELSALLARYGPGTCL
ncbi:uroporphyrinogen-III synthase [Aureimonas populi]|uniref:Uroporphyrinogen-III synthase n=1 Tax=Aureimonas populi TaxID=1701758 RepID=A0ABW5CIU1_9HYPH|nr:uroporphyrinogen-III synthase [Aureimonas populi]